MVIHLGWPTPGTPARIATVQAALSVTFIGIALDQWIVILAGLAIGIVARWAYILSIPRQIKWADCRIDIMMYPMNAVLSVQLTDTAGMHNGKLLFGAAMLGAASTIAFGAIHKKWLTNFLPVAPETVTEIEIRSIKDFPTPSDIPADMADLLREIDEADRIDKLRRTN